MSLLSVCVFPLKVSEMEALSLALPPLPRSGPNPQIQEFLQDASNTRALSNIISDSVLLLDILVEAVLLHPWITLALI